MTHNEIRDQLEAYALGALDEDERAVVAAHVAGCQECGRLLGDYEQVVGSLPAALALAAPVPATAGEKRRLRRRLGRPILWPGIAAAAAVGVVLAAVVLWGMRINDSLAEERALRDQLASQQEIVFEVIDSAQSVRIVLQPPVPGATSYGKVFTRPDLPYVVAMAGRLPQPPAGELYHLWLTLDDGDTVLAGRLAPNRDGFASLLYEADHNGPTPTSARVTAEPAGANQPHGVPVLLWVHS